MATKMPRTKCHLVPTILEFPLSIAYVVLLALEEPGISAAKVAAVIHVQSHYEISVPERKVEHHRLRGADCPCRRQFR